LGKSKRQSVIPNSLFQFSLEKEEGVDLEIDHFRWREPNAVSATRLMCDKCRAGQMVEYERTFVNGGKEAKILGTKCDRCGYTKLDSDDDIWSIVGL
jgi:hypothetical protein